MKELEGWECWLGVFFLSGLFLLDRLLSDMFPTLDRSLTGPTA
jgi:hypothetical protein